MLEQYGTRSHEPTLHINKNTLVQEDSETRSHSEVLYLWSYKVLLGIKAN